MGLKSNATERKEYVKINIYGVPVSGCKLLPYISLSNQERKQVDEAEIPANIEFVNGQIEEADKQFVRPARTARRGADGKPLKDEENNIIFEDLGYDEAEVEFYFKLTNVAKEKDISSEDAKVLEEQVYTMSFKVKDCLAVSKKGKPQWIDANGLSYWESDKGWKPRGFDESTKRQAYMGEADLVRAITEMLCLSEGSFALGEKGVRGLFEGDYFAIEDAINKVVYHSEGGFPNYRGFRALFGVGESAKGAAYQLIYLKKFISSKGDPIYLHRAVLDDAATVDKKGNPKDPYPFKGKYFGQLDGISVYKEVAKTEADNPRKLIETPGIPAAPETNDNDDGEDDDLPF